MDRDIAEAWIRRFLEQVGATKTDHERPWRPYFGIPLAEGVAWFKRCAEVQASVGTLLSTHFVYTEWVDNRPIVWDAANRRHLGCDHPERHISVVEIEEVLYDVDRIATDLTERQARQVIGRTSAGRWLVVIWIDD